jgi:hypothetical protein
MPIRRAETLRLRRLAAIGLGAALLAAPATAAAREPFPHEFKHNMGYCAPFLAQLRLPSGDAVRPFINQTIHDLTRDGPFLGQKNVGDLYSDRARSEEDTNCLQR